LQVLKTSLVVPIKRTDSLSYFEVFFPSCLQLLDPVRVTIFEKNSTLIDEGVPFCFVF
jgi:hypothetical protein